MIRGKTLDVQSPNQNSSSDGIAQLPSFLVTKIFRGIRSTTFHALQVMIASFTKHLKSNKRTLSLLEQCLLTMREIKQIQAHLVVSGTLSDPFAAGKIIAFCAISDRGDLDYARLLFHSIPRPSTFIWNTMIRAFVEANQPFRALSLYKQMLEKGPLPNNYTFSFVLRACIDVSSLLDGQKFHAQIVRFGWESYDFVLNGLVHLYVNCNFISSAQKLFDSSSVYRDVVTWTAMINGYAKAGQIDVARQLFDEMPERNVVSWSAMITNYAQVGMFGEALDLFNEMQLAGLRPNHAGIVGALTACAFLGALDQGRWIHVYVERNGMELDKVLGTALIDMYAKCGCIETANQVFNQMPERDVFSWTSLISGQANHGHSTSAIDLFVKMQNEGVKPNEVTFIAVLSACSRMGLADEGLRFFKSMEEVYGIQPGVEHYGCLVDLLGRGGLLEEAKRVVTEMPMEPDSYVLGALLNACRMHGEVELGEKTVKHFMDRTLDHGGVHVLLSNMYASASRWEDVAKVRKGMEDKKVKKVPGCSLIEVNGVVIEFVAGDRSHFHMEEEVILLLLGMDMQLKSSGSTVDASFDATL